MGIVEMTREELLSFDDEMRVRRRLKQASAVERPPRPRVPVTAPLPRAAAGGGLPDALALVALGLSIIPLSGKIPRLPWKVYQCRKSTSSVVAEWFRTWPTTDLAIVTGAISGVVVLDVDGIEGRESLGCLGNLPQTWRVKTGRGEHLYFAHPGTYVPNRAGFLPGLDFRGDGGYVVAPPSLHASGVRYEWADAPDSTPLAPCPAWLVA